MKKSNKDKCEDVIQSMFNFKGVLVDKDENGFYIKYDNDDVKHYSSEIKINTNLKIDKIIRILEIINEGDEK